MPFTISHIAAILPLSRSKIPFTALCIGSVVPDFPLFTTPKLYAMSHSMLGILSVNLLVGLAVYYIWTHIWQPVLPRILPHWLGQYFQEASKKEHLFKILIGLLIGASTHVFWDNFTHGYGFVAKNVWFYKEPVPYLGIPIYAFFQHLSSFAGGFALLIFMLNKKPLFGERTPMQIALDRQLNLKWCGFVALSLLVVLPNCRFDQAGVFLFDFFRLFGFSTCLSITCIGLFGGKSLRLASPVRY